ncbi:MAG: sugar phosphate isomerase/epimerase [Spirochaetales bacterium]|jgi:sugar phosphate isomerase/epimerase|nr:sugar phosphate isomerase/epimerase [Spirochaetales bacterium]
MSIALGALVSAHELDKETLKLLKKLGFETLSISFWETLGEIDLDALAAEVHTSGLEVAALSIWGNPLQKEETAEGWKRLISGASRFGDPFVTGFAGRVPGSSVEDSLESWKALFSELLDLAHQNNCKGLLMENCRLGDTWKQGKWNIAINDDAFNLLFSMLADERLGLEWEPCHQVEAFVDPVAQLSRWLDRIKHIHGKDARVDWEALKTFGLFAKRKAIHTTLPGMGDTDWHALCSLLEEGGYQGSIDLETTGSSFFEDLEGKGKALSYLKACRH